MTVPRKHGGGHRATASLPFSQKTWCLVQRRGDRKCLEVMDPESGIFRRGDIFKSLQQRCRGLVDAPEPSQYDSGHH